MIYHDWSAKDSLNRYQKIGFSNKDYLPLTLHPKKTECKKESSIPVFGENPKKDHAGQCAGQQQ